MLQLITDKPGWWFLGCLALGIGYAAVLYRNTNAVFTPRLRWVLTVFRALMVTLLSFLLLSPLIRTRTTETEKPLLIIAADNSESIIQSGMSAGKSLLDEQLDAMEKKLSGKFQVQRLRFSDKVEEGKPLDFTGQETDYTSLIRELNARYTNRNVGAVVVATDGLFNKGGNPVYQSLDFNAPLYTLALGDTVIRKDVLIASVDYNRVVYLGNSFPVEVTVDARQCNSANLQVTVRQDSAVLFARPLTVSGNRYRIKVPVILDARKKGLMRLKVAVSQVDGEITTANNEREIFVEVKESKEKILLLANAPHPDLGFFKELIESSQNYEVTIAMADGFNGKAADFNLVIFHNLPSSTQLLDKIYPSIKSAGIPGLFVLGAQSNLNALNKLDAGLQVVTANPGKTTPVAAAFNPGFSLFTLEDAVRERLPKFPPLQAPFGEYKPTGAPAVLCYQQVGSVKTDEPLIFFMQDDRMRTGFVCGEGWWRWTLSESAASGDQNVSRELLIKAIQYLSVKDSRSKFRIRLKNSFNENEPVLVDAELYNDNYELVNSPDVTLDVMDHAGKKFPYTFSKSERSYNLNAGFLPPGEYRYMASALLGDRKNTATGTFTVTALHAEQTETVADHHLLSAWAGNHDGRSYAPAAINDLVKLLEEDSRSKSVSYSQVKLQDLINLKWFFFLLLAFLSLEWLLRKRAGSY